MENHNELTLPTLLKLISKKKVAFIFFVIISLLLGYLLSSILPKKYEANALIQIEQDKANPLQSVISSSIPSVVGLGLSGSGVETEIELLKSRSILLDVINKHRLDVDASLPKEIVVQKFNLPHGEYKLDLISGKEYQLRNSDQITLEGGLGETLVNNYGDVLISGDGLVNKYVGSSWGIVRLDENEAVERFEDELRVSERGKQTGLIQLSFNATSPLLAKTIVDDLANVFLRLNIEGKSKEAELALAFVEKQLPRIKSELELAELELNEFRKKNNTIDITLETQSKLGQMVELEKGITQLSLKKEQLLTKFSSDHPKLTGVNAQIEELKVKQKDIEQSVGELPQAQQHILELTRNVEVNNQVYLQMLNTQQQFKLAKASTVGNVRVVDYALLPTEPSSPKKYLIIAAFLFLGLVIFVLYVLFEFYFDKGVKSAVQLERELDLSVIGSLPAVNKKDGDTDLLYNEAIKSLRTSIEFMSNDIADQSSLIVITSAEPNVGKSYVSTSLALSLSELDKKTLLIDGDLRRGKLYKYFDFENRNGLTDYLLSSEDAKSFIKSINEKLFVINCGNSYNSPSELLSSKKFSDLITSLKVAYDYIIIDSPPVLAVTDPELIARFADHILLIGEYGRTTIGQYKATKKKLISTGAQGCSIVLNKVDLKESMADDEFGQYQYSYVNE
ncbi:MAG: polysaccharide biosynthesis tyrosine autokinase [Gammaproteobacteria bacterium]|nr:polysaccharide biosynthesis tyrosine autokinase [Gammaproteobacteria bacterium]